MRISNRCWVLLLALGLPPGALLPIPSAYALNAQQQPYSQPELDRMLAPIALYPDPLLSQILMAATYPLEVVEAARWTRMYPGLRGDEAVRAVRDRDWNPSVKSLVAFPNILQRMNENLEWTRSLGDAFLEQGPNLMDTVQQLRQRARAAGSLSSDERQRVVDDRGRLIIEPVRPEIVYVPYYDPWVAYGLWWWPSHPPVVWVPWPGYTVVQRPHGPRLAVFAWGPAVQVSVGFFFGGLDWHRRQVDVVRVNYYYVNRPLVVAPVHVAQPGRWQHDPAHRRGLAYADPVLNRRYAAFKRSDERADKGERREDRHEPERRPEPRIVPARPIVSNQPIPHFDSRTEDIIRSVPPLVPPLVPSVAPNSAQHPPVGNPSPARQMQIQEEREKREERREAREPSPARQQQLKQEKDRRSERTEPARQAHAEKKVAARETRAEKRQDAVPENHAERQLQREERRQDRREAREDSKQHTAQR